MKSAAPSVEGRSVSPGEDPLKRRYRFWHCFFGKGFSFYEQFVFCFFLVILKIGSRFFWINHLAARTTGSGLPMDFLSSPGLGIKA